MLRTLWLLKRSGYQLRYQLIFIQQWRQSDTIDAASNMNTEQPMALNLLEEKIIENQRGIGIWGYQFFSSSLLIPILDPPRFQLILHSADGSVAFSNALPTNAFDSFNYIYPVDFVKRRNDFKWYVLVGVDDTDGEGWRYSWNFCDKHWKSSSGVVRRRIWVRLPESKNVDN